MMHVEPVYDMDLIKRTLNDPFVYWHLADEDTSDIYEPFEPSDVLIYLGVWFGGVYLGIIMAMRVNSVMWHGHLCLLKHAAGNGVESIKAAIKYIFDYTDANNITVEIPCDYKHALAAVKRSGMELVGINNGAIRKHGKLLDLHIFSVRT